jgi:hypothetical protein
MKFLTGVLILTIASAVGLIVLQFFGKKSGGAKSAAPPAPPKAPEAKVEVKTPPASDSPCALPPLSESGYGGGLGLGLGSGSGSGPARQVRAKLKLSHVLDAEFSKLDADAMAWKPIDSIHAIQVAKSRIMQIVRDWENGIYKG